MAVTVVAETQNGQRLCFGLRTGPESRLLHGDLFRIGN